MEDNINYNLLPDIGEQTGIDYTSLPDIGQKKKEEPAWSGVPDVLQPQEVTQPENYVEQQAELPRVAKNKAIPVTERYARYKGEKLQKAFTVLDEPQNRELFERGMAGDQQAFVS